MAARLWGRANIICFFASRPRARGVYLRHDRLCLAVVCLAVWPPRYFGLPAFSRSYAGAQAPRCILWAPAPPRTPSLGLPPPRSPHFAGGCGAAALHPGGLMGRRLSRPELTHHPLPQVASVPVASIYISGAGILEFVSVAFVYVSRCSFFRICFPSWC